VRRDAFKKTAAVTVLSILALMIASSSMTVSVNALVFPKSSNVAVVPDRTCSNGGTLPNTGFPNGDTFSFTNLSPATLADGAIADPLTTYDTLVLLTSDFDFDSYWADGDFSGRVTSFVDDGGKLIIYDSESTNSDFSGFIYPFTSSAPGAYGASGPCWIVENNTLSSNDTASASYLNTALLIYTDAAGDANAMVSLNSNWYVDMVAKNTFGVTGPVHTYALYGDGLIIYNGLDIDYMSYYDAVISNGNGEPNNYLSGGHVLMYIWYLELCGQTLPTSGAVSVSGLALTPVSATNYIDSDHTVTARVTDVLAEPIPGVAVDFEITAGPNFGLTGSGVMPKTALCGPDMERTHGY